MQDNQAIENNLFRKFQDSYGKLLQSEKFSDEFVSELKNLGGFWSEIKKESFDRVPDDFVDMFADIKYRKLIQYAIDDKGFDLWLNVVQYLKEDDEIRKNQYGNRVESILSDIADNGKIAGSGKLDRNLIDDFDRLLADGDMIKNVYLSGDEQLRKIFFDKVPKLKYWHFDKESVPSDLLDEKLQGDEFLVQSLAGKTSQEVGKIEESITDIQRRYRGNRRREEFSRLLEKELNGQQYEDKPYNPRFCSEELAKRIIDLSKEIKLFDDIKHLTSVDALSNILDVGFRGRKSMVRDCKTFRKAALSPYDCARGDADVICLSGSEIDKRCMKENTVELAFDLEKIRQLENDSSNPCIFFKQRDLGFFKDKTREVEIGDLKINFNHTSYDNRASSNFMTPIVFNNVYRSAVHDFSLISHNFAEMDSVLIMNFFRFLEGVIDNSDDGRDFVKKIYSRLENLNDEELRKALTELGKQASDTMEFNFYGHFLPDSTLLKEINFYKEAEKLEFSLKVDDLIDSLKNGDRKYFDLAKNNIPQLFESYRFLEYLQSNNTNEELKSEIKSMIQESKIPDWRNKVLHNDKITKDKSSSR